MARKILSRARNLARDAKEALETTREKVEEYKDTTEKMIKQHPLTSVAIAAAVGALVALGVNALAQRRRHTWRDRLRDYF
ncbi:DUF883 family protein [Candidatus Pacearchaeota archaeon]|nr:DUF883 family protein [Candidatus Pacearchaeota archaeon]